MKILHEKSPCCRSGIARFGGRRRQCSQCEQTWRVWKHKPGRKRKRTAAPVLGRTLIDRLSLKKQSRRGVSSFYTIRYRFRSALQLFLDKPARFPLVDESEILLIDALWFRFYRKRWTLYLAGLRSIKGNEATFLDPVLMAGKESATHWREVLDGIPSALRGKIIAMVSDGLCGTGTIAKERGWVHQRCHFHLLSKLNSHRGRYKKMAGKEIREAIYQNIRRALAVCGSSELRLAVSSLEHLLSHPSCTRHLRGMVQEFLKDLLAFRSYLIYPEMNLPSTNNTVESMGGIIRNAARSLCTPRSLARWAKAIVRLHPRIKCNGAENQPN